MGHPTPGSLDAIQRIGSIGKLAAVAADADGNSLDIISRTIRLVAGGGCGSAGWRFLFTAEEKVMFGIESLLGGLTGSGGAGGLASGIASAFQDTPTSATQTVGPIKGGDVYFNSSKISWPWVIGAAIVGFFLFSLISYMRSK